MNADLKSPLIDLEADNNATGRKRQETQRERLSEESYMYCVYWIKAKEHTDVASEGYVGITKNLQERMRAHKKNKRKTPLTDALKKYGKDNVEVVILESSISLEEALAKEEALRPTQNVGWNCQKGGELGVEPSWYEVKSNREKHRNATAVATRKGIAEKDTKEARAERARNSWKRNRKSYEGISTGERNPRAKLKEEQVRTIKYDLIPKGLSDKEIASMYGVKHYVISFIRKGKNWSYV